MKSLPRFLGLAFLALILVLTLANCSLSSEKIASRLEPSIVRLFYRNQTGHGTGFFVSGEAGVCTVLTAAHVVKGEGENLLQTKDGKVWQVAKVEIFPSNIDLALVTFKPIGEKCNYSALKIGNSESLKTGSSIYISGFPIRGGKLVSQFVDGKVSALDNLARGYGVSYQALTVGGMSGAPVMDNRGQIVAVHGMSDVEVVKSFASLQASLSESKRSTFQQALKRVETGVQRLTFSWGIPINLFEELRGETIAVATEKQEVDLQQELEEERRKRQEAERRVQKLEVERQKQLQEAEQRAKQEREAERQRQLEEEKRQRQEAERREQELKTEKQELKQKGISLFLIDKSVPLLSPVRGLWGVPVGGLWGGWENWGLLLKGFSYFILLCYVLALLWYYYCKFGSGKEVSISYHLFILATNVVLTIWTYYVVQ